MEDHTPLTPKDYCDMAGRSNTTTIDLYKDEFIPSTHREVNSFLVSSSATFDDSDIGCNPMLDLAILCNKLNFERPVYNMDAGNDGPDHNKRFEVECRVGNESKTEWSTTKKQARRRVAYKWLLELKNSVPERLQPHDEEGDSGEPVYANALRSIISFCEASPNILACHPPRLETLKRQILNKVTPAIGEVEFACKMCDHHGQMTSAAEGRRHWKQDHSILICPTCMESIPHFRHYYVEHIKKHFVERNSRREEIKCLFCEQITNYSEMWDHIDAVHIAQLYKHSTETKQQTDHLNSSLGPSNESSTSQRIPMDMEQNQTIIINATPPPLVLVPNPLEMPLPKSYQMVQNPLRIPTNGNYPANSHHSTPESLGASRNISSQDVSELVNEMLSYPNTATTSTEVQISTDRALRNECDHHFIATRKYLTPEQLNELTKSYLTNPNTPWKPRAREMASKLGLTFEKTYRWFVSTRARFKKGNFPRWVKDIFRPENNVFSMAANNAQTTNGNEVSTLRGMAVTSIPNANPRRSKRLRGEGNLGMSNNILI